MKPFGKWLADFELPPKDEPVAVEPHVEVVINYGGELIVPSVEDIFNAPCGFVMSGTRSYTVDFATGTIQFTGGTPTAAMAAEFKITIGASETQCVEHVVPRELYELCGSRSHLSNDEWLAIVNAIWSGMLPENAQFSELVHICGNAPTAVFIEREELHDRLI